ncbi:MAG: symmetrical bis(5'-nucleosyl)-tetraphosphatase [Halorhodospira halophila]|uniref:symmetrical bis(5'-nucleosyl)-tetraphosphatase n=1 Tax=Halorhodospira TaxID=85108 RepID=UPI0019117111|nr:MULTISPECIES: symmetrical bis(5'-nucleosyl)-tetraphosphatase [Halorhodospira]MBK5936359.1 bis(5'-nucleosyl)-tetraphosphatase (symmetrical) [Halorhodospira halophila]MBK5943552.1 bis(5'-nucleosyl)-tetraphosphatase (symmetrical) [Halorhodospira halophila]MCC3750144.1 symmetrical bis(5'-nucleosyl)-tetraphosphatase [Halorhodospira halophila]MCG5527082.1 symmetrical bis(5'-nucleosyl)-tetraphosphatase [Halorhodospira halophila]MCG5532289.1 symmetrical bis(5'-nucleosyl)-tetraphosphatase [Halorhodo
MATYAIGDIQGCCDPLKRLLEQIRFDPAQDTIWFVGDLVNRGPDSLGVLRLVRNELGDRAITVLGNHDIHLMSVWSGHGRLKNADTLRGTLDAPDVDELIEWLRRRPLMHVDESLGYAMAHAGLPPAWSVAEAKLRAHELERALRGDIPLDDLMDNIYGNRPIEWSDELEGYDRLRFITNAFMRMRFVDGQGRLLLREKGRPDRAPEGHYPWFVARRRLRASPDPVKLVTGHWSLLGFHNDHGVLSIDTGCQWGNTLTAVRIDDGSEAVHSLKCPEHA